MATDTQDRSGLAARGEQAADAPEPRAEPARHEARALTRGGDRATILHGGQAYTLRITRQNKLILTK